MSFRRIQTVPSNTPVFENRRARQNRSISDVSHTPIELMKRQFTAAGSSNALAHRLMQS